MTAADLRTLAELLHQLTAAGFAVALDFGGEITIKARPATALRGEPFADGTRFTDGTGWVEGEETEGDQRSDGAGRTGRALADRGPAAK